MNHFLRNRLVLWGLSLACGSSLAEAQAPGAPNNPGRPKSKSVLEETLPPLENGKAPQTFDEMWAGFDPQAEPLDVKILKEWEQDGAVLRVLRYRTGVFKVALRC